MTGKLTTVLIKKEAEAYRAQGLHKEAITLFEKLMATSPNIDPSIKNALQEQVEGLAREMRSFEARKDMPLTSEEILRIREGWGQQASQADIMICAQALFHVGAYEDALVEYQRLLQAGCDDKKLARAMALCFAKAYPPQKMPQAVDAVLAGVCLTPQQAAAYQLRLAQTLAGQEDKTHALAFCRHLTRDRDLPPQAKSRLKQMVAMLQNGPAGESDQKPAEQVPSKKAERRRFSRLFRFMTKNPSDR